MLIFPEKHPQKIFRKPIKYSSSQEVLGKSSVGFVEHSDKVFLTYREKVLK
jgi:hypothetical protein